jgi:hypothetical protein
MRTCSARSRTFGAICTVAAASEIVSVISSIVAVMVMPPHSRYDARRADTMVLEPRRWRRISRQNRTFPIR